jgi:hypothetical protein
MLTESKHHFIYSHKAVESARMNYATMQRYASQHLGTTTSTDCFDCMSFKIARSRFFSSYDVGCQVFDTSNSHVGSGQYHKHRVSPLFNEDRAVGYEYCVVGYEDCGVKM